MLLRFQNFNEKFLQLTVKIHYNLFGFTNNLNQNQYALVCHGSAINVMIMLKYLSTKYANIDFNLLNCGLLCICIRGFKR